MDKKKKIVLDMLLNIISSAIPVFLLQLQIYPMISARLSQEQYGNMITTVSVIMVISASLGNVLNNVRLLLNDSYREKKLKGDFNYILILFILLSVAVSVIVLVFLRLGDAGEIILSLIVGVLLLIQGYLMVAFRIELNFYKILISNVCLAAGYLLGYLLFAWFQMGWQYVYIVGYLFSSLYILFHCDLLKEPVRKTELFPGTAKECRFLLEASLIGNLLNYSDRILISPIIGPKGVTIYYVSTLFGKLITQLIGPISGVILGYLAKIKSLEKKLENGMILVTAVICTGGYFFCVLLAGPILTFLYPQYVEEAMTLIPITTAATMFMTMASAISPFVLKFCPRQWQVRINAITLACYVAGALCGFWMGGMKGFCMGILLTFLIKTAFLIVILKRSKTKIEESM